MLAAFELFSYFLALIYAGIWVPEFFTATDKKIEPWSFIATATLSGLLTVYLAYLAVGNFQNVFYICHLIGAVSALWLIYKARKGVLNPTSLPFEGWHWGLLGLAGIIVFAIIFTGISNWEARSIWYFQAKILHYTGSLNAPDWHNQHFSFAFTAFPKLYPVVIAFLTSSWPGWNEYAPKWTLILLLLPIVASLFSLKIKPSSVLIIFLALFGISGSALWDGSPSAYVAAFFAMGLLNFAYYQKTREKIHMLQSLLFMGIIPSFNPDGIAMVVCFALALSFFNSGAGAILRERNISKFIVIPASAFLFWQLRKMEFHFSDSIIANGETFSRMWTRVVEIKPFVQVVRNTVLAHLDILAFMGLVAIYFRIPAVRANHENQIVWIRKDYTWILVAAALYSIFNLLVYWATPFNVQWYASAYLINSALSVKFALIVYIALCLDPPLETAPDHDEDEEIVIE